MLTLVPLRFLQHLDFIYRTTGDPLYLFESLPPVTPRTMSGSGFQKSTLQDRYFSIIWLLPSTPLESTEGSHVFAANARIQQNVTEATTKKRKCIHYKDWENMCNLMKVVKGNSQTDLAVKAVICS